MSDGTADRLDVRQRAFLPIISRLLAATLVAGLGLVALVSAPASAAGPATQIVLSSSTGTLLLVGKPTTLTATIEDGSGNTVNTGTDSTVMVTFAQILGTGVVSPLGPVPAIGGVATDVITPSSVGDDVVNLQASATITPGLTFSNVLDANFDADHGIAIAKGCSSTTLIGQPLKCSYQITNNPNIDTADDTLTIDNITDNVFAFDGTVVSPNLLPSLTLSFSGGAFCNGGHTLCTLPSGSTIKSSPASFYTVAPDDYLFTNHKLTDRVSVIWDDLCDGGSGNCSTGANTQEEAPSSTTVKKNTPSVSTVLTPPSPVSVGILVKDQATLSSASPFAGGTVSYAVFSNNTCTTLVAALGTDPVTNGTVGPSNSWTATLGNFWFQATYSGDAGDIGPVSSPCSSEPLTVANPPGIAITKLPGNQTVPPGGTATWTIVVTNISSATSLTNVTVTDPFAPACARIFSGTLAPGASEPGYSCSLAGVTASFTNTATVTGTPPVGPVVTASAQANVVVGTPSAVELWVNPANEGGSDTNNTCLLETKPCATIEYGLTMEAQLAPDSVGSVINLSKGTFNNPECLSSTTPDVPPGCDSMFAALTPANSNVTIIGSGATGSNAVVVEPVTCSALPVVAGGPSNGQQAIVVFNTGEDGITIENMNLNGAAVAGGGCPNYTAGVIDTDGTTGNAVVGDSIESGTTYGILTNDGADSTIISNTLSPVLCTTTVKGPNTGLNAGWTSPANLYIKTLPTCAKFKESGHGSATGVFINGVAYCAFTSATKKTLVITGTPTPVVACKTGGTPISNSGGLDIATGAMVVFNTSAAPFTQWGIACNSPLQLENQATDCALSDNTVVAGGTVYGDAISRCGGLPPVGIVATGGATANVDGNSVSDVADVIMGCPVVGETTNDGIGIGLLPDLLDGCSAGPSVIGVNDANSPTTGHGNKLGSTSANDNGIVVSGNIGAGCSDVNPAYQVNGNSVTSGNKAGIVLTNLGFGNGTLQIGEPMANNSVSGVTGGAGIELEGVKAQTIGGNLVSGGNSSTGNGEGLVLAPCIPVALHPLTPPGCATYAGAPVSGGPEATQGNVIQSNTMTGNIAFGVLAEGDFQPNEIAASTSTPLESSGNTFNGNSWGTAANASNGTNPAAIDGAEVMDGTGWGGGCHSVLGDCPNTAGVGPLLFKGPNTIFSSSSPGSATFVLSVCNAGTVAEVLPVGTQITFNPAPPDDGGTFFVTKVAIIASDVPSVGGCTDPSRFYNLNLQAVAPADVGSLDAPSGQPYILGQDDTITVNVNGSTVVASANFYGKGITANSCTPAGVTQAVGTGPAPLLAPHPAVTTPNIFGATFVYSSTLEASTGGVNATYSAC